MSMHTHKHHHHKKHCGHLSLQLKTGKLLTKDLCKAIKGLTKKSAPARTTLQRMDKILCKLHARADKWAKACHKKTRH